jgi:Ca2+-dependent lipid-binding protein
MKVGSTRRLRTTIVTSTTDPVWEERFEVQVADEADQLTFEIKVGHSRLPWTQKQQTGAHTGSCHMAG